MPPTSPEEIEKQHQEAVKLVQQEEKYTPISFHDEIPLSHKQRPLCEVIKEESSASTSTATNTTASSAEEKKDDTTTTTTAAVSNFICVSSRGHVDISKLADLVREGYNGNYTTTSSSDSFVSPTNLWHPINASQHNTTITRPSHDSWGIHKIILLFCDDFLQSVFEMPYYTTKLKHAIEPVLSLLQIQSTQLVRLLLASLPPNTTIPTHHDTGEWVKHTHRVHVPVIVRQVNRILFTCGPTLHTMQRIQTSPGHVFEINNQAKHAVSNCMNSDYRVHLILDYVEPDFTLKRRIQLEPGERLLQTRRSIDRVCEKNTRPTPTFVILGAQKAGTTSLYDYMNQHPLVIKARRRETHCLDWRYNNKSGGLQHCLKFFYTQELRNHPSCLTGDSSPSYLLDSRRVIPNLQSVYEHWKSMKLFIILRDPVCRVYSHYNMVTSTVGATPQQIQTRGVEWHNKSFETVVKEDMERMQQCGLIPYWNIQEGVFNQSLFDKFVGSNEEHVAWDKYLEDCVPLHTGSHSPISRGMYELNLRPWLEKFDSNQFLILKLEDMKKSSGVQETMEKVWKHLELPSYTVTDDSAKNTRSYDPMDESMQQYLQRFYEPHNRRLEKLLGVEWKDPWPYTNERE